jgi:hypothetical protein
VANTASYLSALAALLAAVVLLSVGSRASSQQRFFIVALVSLAGASAAAAPATLQVAVRLEPVPHLARAFNAALAMVGSFFLVGVVLYSTRAAVDARRLIRRHAVLLMAWMVVVVACLYLSGAPTTAIRTQTDSNLGVTAFLVLRFAYTGSATVAFLILNYRTTRLPETKPLTRLGFRLAMAATSTAGLHAVWTVAVHLQLLDAPVDQDIAAVLLAVALTMLALGATAPVWGGGAVWAFRRWRARWACRALSTQWAFFAELSTAVDVTPIVQLHPTVEDQVAGELYRYCIALRDLQLAVLRDLQLADWPMAHPAVRDWAADAARRYDLDARAATTITEAAMLVTALDGVRAGITPDLAALHRGHRRWTAGNEQAGPPNPSPAPYATPDLLEETKRLVCVGFAARHSQVVAELRRRAAIDPARQSGHRPPTPCPIPVDGDHGSDHAGRGRAGLS